MNEQTVTEVYVVDETTIVDLPGGQVISKVSPAVRKVLEVGGLCNNAVYVDGAYAGQATDVALVNVLAAFGMTDPRAVSGSLHLRSNTR
jgi:Ca2+-transporting ATPase